MTPTVLDQVERALSKGGHMCVVVDLISVRPLERKAALDALSEINEALAALRAARKEG